MQKIASQIEIEVKTSFSDLQSNIEQEEFFFTYHISIYNHSRTAVQLISRKWLITDSYGENRFVEGKGVVGEQPVIEPGGVYEYYSGCLLKTGFGKMHGSYLFHTLPDGLEFEAAIPAFHLVLPWVLN